MSKHTKGTWFFDLRAFPACSYLMSANGKRVTMLAEITPECLPKAADRFLISHAPDLFEALEDLVLALTEQNSTGKIKLSLEVSRALTLGFDTLESLKGGAK